MTNKEAKNVIDNVLDFATPKNEESGGILEFALDMASKSLDTIEKIKDIIREPERYEVSNSFENPRPNKADYDAVAADKYQKIWKVISEAENNRPDCFISNENPYPLCKGRGEDKCHNCCIYEDYEEYHSPYND